MVSTFLKIILFIPALSYGMYVPYPTSSGGSLQRVEYAVLGNTCTVTSSSSSWVSSTSNGGTGDCTVNYNTSPWSAAPTCICNANADAKICTVKQAPSTGTAEFADYSNGGAASAAGMFIMCFGPRTK